MTVTNSETAKRGVTPVLGVVLLVGLTVALGAIVAVYAIDMVQDQQSDVTQPWDEDTPDVAFDIERVGDQVLVTHNDSESISATEIQIRGDLEYAPVGFDGYTVQKVIR